MKTYFKIIKYLQEALLGTAIFLMMYLPLMIVFRPDVITSSVSSNLYFVSHIFLFFVMTIRPLADIFTKIKWIRPLVILRKGTGVMSASIVVSFILAKLMVDPSGYLSSIFTLKYWSLVNYAIFAHVADISALILIITSNNFSKSILGSWWKKIQQLSYVYFYGSVLYVYLSYGGLDLLFALIIVTLLTFIAFTKNKQKLAKSFVTTSSSVLNQTSLSNEDLLIKKNYI
jgi:DMSO/TMAO reductase YedYZ heme-binding membrane subunit